MLARSWKRVRGSGDYGMTAKRYRVCFWSDGNVLKLTVAMDAQAWYVNRTSMKLLQKRAARTYHIRQGRGGT